MADVIGADAARAGLKVSPDRTPLATSASFVCPHPNCGVFTSQIWGAPVRLNTYGGHRDVGQGEFIFAVCWACKQETIWHAHEMIWPQQVAAPPPAADMPEIILADFEEARRICNVSPRGAAALLRLAVQKLCPVLGSTKSDINAAIGELVANGKISQRLQQALDTVRVIGNEAVHPGELNVADSPEIVASLFKLINFIVLEAITRPKEIVEIYGSLPAKKLAGIEARDGKS